MISNNELIEIKGGAYKITAALLSSLSRGINTILNLGQTLGSAIRRIISKKYCK